MNLREWARATHRAMKEQPPEDRSELTAAEVEEVMRMSISVLGDRLSSGENLRINDLGTFWVEEIPEMVIISNLGGSPQPYHLPGRRRVRFKASSRLTEDLRKD